MKTYGEVARKLYPWEKSPGTHEDLELTETFLICEYSVSGPKCQ
jgi:hypothetical protein